MYFWILLDLLQGYKILSPTRLLTQDLDNIDCPGGGGVAASHSALSHMERCPIFLDRIVAKDDIFGSKSTNSI